MIFSITDILAGLVKIGVNLTDDQTELLKWRLSPDAQKYYNDKENVEFYRALTKGDIKVVDAIRKEKQKRIDALKAELLSMIMILLIPLTMCSCSMLGGQKAPDMKVIEQKWNTESLTDKDRTYKIEDKTPVKLEEESKPVNFKGNWFVVNEDMIKTFNENQDTLIKSLEKTKELKEQTEKKDKYYTYIIGGLVLLLLLSVVLNIFRRKG